MTDWTINASGIYADDANPPPDDLWSYDFLVAKDGATFHANVQKAYEVGIPCILFVDNYVSRWHMGLTYDRNDWDAAVEDDPIIQQLDAAILSNGVKRAIHGVMIDTSYVTMQGEDEILTHNWFVQRAMWLLDTVFTRYKLPIYLYQSKTPVNTYRDGNARQAVILLLKDYGVSTVDIKELTPDAKPSLPYNDAGWRWYFWLHKLTPRTMIYNGTPEELYGELDYEHQAVIPEPPVVPPVVPPEEPPVIPTVEHALENIAAWVTSVNERLQVIEDTLTEIDRWIKSYNRG